MSKRRPSSDASHKGCKQLAGTPDYPTRHQRRRHTATVNHPAGGQATQGRTQWDAMTEVSNRGGWNATRMALLIFVRYAPRSAVGAALMEAAMRMIETLSHHH